MSTNHPTITTDSAKVSQTSHVQMIAIYLAISIPVCLLGMWRLDVISMEGIIVDGARHMVRTHEWFVPKLYGTIYAFKPALAYWMVAVSEALLGQGNPWAVRLPFVGCAIALGLVTYAGVARLSSRRAGLYAALAVVTSPIFIEQARMAGFDMPLSFGTALAMLAALQCLVNKQPAWHWWTLGYLGLTFGFLAKGLPAMAMYFPGLLLACYLTKQMRQLLRWQHLLGLALFVVLAGAYLLLAYRQEGWAAFQDQLMEIGARSAKWNILRMLGSLAKPIIILGIALPWSILVGLLALHPQVRLPDEKSRLLARTTAAFLVAGMIVWMAASTDNTRYYLPMIAPIAVLAGIAADAIQRQQQAAMSSAAASNTDLPLTDRLPIPLLMLVIGLTYWVIFIGVFEPHRMRERTMKKMAAAFSQHLPAGAPVLIDTFDGCSSLFYYLEHEVGRWDIEGSAPPSSPVYAVLINELRRPQEEMLLARTDLHVDVLAKFSGPEKKSYALVKVSPISQVSTTQP